MQQRSAKARELGTALAAPFIAPYDYGEVAAATVVAMSANQFSSFGVGTYVITHPDAGRDVMFHASVVHIVPGLIAFALVLLCGHSIAPHVGAPTLMRYLPGLVLVFATDRLLFMPERVLVRQMRFGTLALLRGSAEMRRARSAGRSGRSRPTPRGPGLTST
jgi:PST family polysaccharide transporter